jgi:hypothetical protein
MGDEEQNKKPQELKPRHFERLFSPLEEGRLKQDMRKNPHLYPKTSSAVKNPVSDEEAKKFED